VVVSQRLVIAGWEDNGVVLSTVTSISLCFFCFFIDVILYMYDPSFTGWLPLMTLINTHS
jgi:hypothetical protein